jgi:hypothetical protein
MSMHLLDMMNACSCMIVCFYFIIIAQFHGKLEALDLFADVLGLGHWD